MPKTYAEIRKLQKLYGYDNLSTDQFSQLLDKVTGTSNYKAGQGTGLGSDLKQLSYGVDQALSAFNLPETFGRAGELAFGESGRKAFEGLPRATVDMLPFLAGGLPGAIAGGATIGVNTYEKTDSPGAGAVSGILSTLMPFAGRGGAAAGRGLFGAAGGSLARTEATAFGAANGLPGVLRGQFATDAAKAGTAQLLNAGGVLKSAGARAAEFYGAQAGMFGANVATQALTNATAAEKGQGWNAAKQAFTPENLLTTALSQTPFVAQHYIPLPLERWGQHWKQREEANFVRDYSTTLNRYDKEVFEPVRRDILQTSPLPSEFRRSPEQVQKAVLNRMVTKAYAKGKGNLVRPEEKMTDLQNRMRDQFGSLWDDLSGKNDLLISQETDLHPYVRQKMFTPEFEAGVRAKMGQVHKEVTGQDLWTKMPLSGKISALNSTDAQEASAASLLTNKTTPEQARGKVVEKRKLGVSSEDAVQEVLAQERAKAERKLQAETLKEERRTKDAETKAVEDQSKMQFIDEWTKRATPEQLDAFKSGLRKLGVNSQADASVAMASAVRNWVATGEKDGVEGLSKYLETTARYQNNAAVDKKAPRTLISKHATKAEASLEADKLRVDDPSRYYQRSGTDVVSWPWLETKQLYGEKAQETFAGEERAAEQHLADVHEAEARLRQETSRPEDYRATELHREATETDAERFVAQMDDEVLAELGGGDDAQRGQERMEALLHTVEKVKGMTQRKLELANTGLWSSVGELNDWIRQAAPHVQEYATKLKQVTANVGKEMSAGTRVETPNYIGERQTLGRLLQSVGLTDHVDEVSKLVTLFDKADAGFAHLQQAHGQDKLPLGLFTVQGTGEKLIWLSAVKDPATRKLFALTHELNGHLLWDMAENGKLDAVATKQMNDYRNMVTENTPFANQRILDEVWGMLPEKYKADKSLQDIVKKSSDDPEEVLANINAVVSLAMVHATPTKWASFLQNMPKPIADFVALIARYGRKIYESISGLQFSRQMGWSSGQIDVAGTRALHGYVDNLHKLLKYDEQRANQARQAIKIDLATDTPLRYATALSDGQMFNEFESDVGATIAKHFGAKNEVDPLSGEKRNKLSGWLDKFGRMESLAVKFPQFRRSITQSARRDAAMNNYEARILEPLGIRMKGAGVKMEKDNPLYEVYNDPRLSRAMSQLTARQLEEGKPLQTLLNERHGPTMEIMQRMMPEEQRKVRETFVRHQQAQQEALTVMRESQYENLALSAARILMETDATKQMRPAQAEALGRQATTAAMNGQPDMASPITPFIMDQSARIEKMMGEFAAREEFISTRRFGKHSLRVEYADPNKPMKALSFDTPEAAERFMKENSGPGVVISKLHRDKKPFNVSEAGLDFLLKMERESTAHLQKQLEAAGIEPGKASEFAASHNLSDVLSREMAARQLPNMSPHRRLVEGYEDLNTLRQQVEYTRMMVRAMTKRASNTEHQLQMLDPELANVEPQVKQQMQDAWNNYLRPDPKSAHMVSMLNYVRYLGLNFLDMAQDTVQPLTGALIPSLINEGFGVGESYKHMTRAMKDVAKEKFGKADLTADERAMLEEYKKGNRGLATFSDDAGNNDYIRIVNDDLAMREGHVTSLGEKLSSVVHAGILTMKNLHKHFTDGAMETSMLATYRLYKSKGLTHAEAQKQAFDATIVGMGAGGKGGRQPGLWNSSPTVGATLTALQTYAFHQIGTWKATAERAFGRVEGLSKAQRKDALKAVGVHTALMLGQAGIFGLPLVGALMAIIDKTFGINSKEEVAALLSKALPEDESRVIQQIALHGIINGVGGVDYASRASVPGVLGLNPQDGFSADSLLGPTYSVVKDVFGGAKGLVTGEPMEAVKAIVPNTLKRGLQAWRDDWEFRRKDGSLIDESTPWDQSIYAVLGLKPARVASLQERDQWQRVDAEIEQQERNEWLKETSQLLESGDILDAKKAIHDRLVDKPGESPAAVAEAVANEVIERQYPKDTSASPGSSARLNQASGLPASQLPETQRLQLVQSLLMQLGMGLPATQHSLQAAQMIDQLRVQQPWLSRQEALAQIAGLTGQAQKQRIRGLSYGLRP